MVKTYLPILGITVPNTVQCGARTVACVKKLKNDVKIFKENKVKIVLLYIVLLWCRPFRLSPVPYNYPNILTVTDGLNYVSGNFWKKQYYLDFVRY